MVFRNRGQHRLRRRLSLLDAIGEADAAIGAAGEIQAGQVGGRGFDLVDVLERAQGGMIALSDYQDWASVVLVFPISQSPNLPVLPTFQSPNLVV